MIDHLSTTPSLPMILRQPPPAPSLSRRVFMARHWLVGGVTCLGALLIPATSRSASLDPAAGELIAMLGTTLIMAGFMLRAWAALYIGGHKNRSIVQDGPYALTRNPLYLGNLVAAAGIVLLSGSPVVAALALPATFLVFLLTIRSEEANLASRFGTAFTAYCAAVPMLVPRSGAIRAFLGEAGPKIISHRNLERELWRGATAVGLGLLAFVLGNLPV